jgi:hypothetical protein
MNDRVPQAVPAQLTESKGTNLGRELFTSNLRMSGLAMLKYDDWGPHPMFGKMTLSEWGKLLQIHIDYHLKQFAA